MARLSNAAITMLLALQAACFRHAREDNSEVKVDATATLQLSNAFDNHSAAEETTNANFSDSVTLQHSEAFDEDSAADETTNATFFTTATLQRRETSEKHSAALETSIATSFNAQRSICAEYGETCTCLGAMTLLPKDAPQHGVFVSGYQKPGTVCRLESFRHCKPTHREYKICQRLSEGAQKGLFSLACWCDNAIKAGWKKQYTDPVIIGSGGNGAIVKATDAENKVVAVKFIPFGTRPADLTEIEQEAFEKTLVSTEIELQRKASEKTFRVPKVYDNWLAKDIDIINGKIYYYLFFVQDFIDGEDLFSIIKRHGKQGGMNEKEVFHYFWQLSTTVGVLHAIDIVHRDIKPENIMISNEEEEEKGKRLSVIDFGAATLGKRNLKGLVGTKTYRAPEMEIVAGSYDEKVDIWSMGVVLYVMVYSRRPPKPLDFERHFDENTPNFDNKESLKNCIDLMKNMLVTKSDGRPDAVGVLHHKWIESMEERTREGPTFEELDGIRARVK